MLSQYKLSDLKKLPNILSILRLILIPVFVRLYLIAQTSEDYQIVAMIVLFSGLTDLLDGFIARRFNMITEIGKVLDPVADKLTQLAIIICLVTRYRLMRPLLVLFLVKESLMGIVGLYFMNRKELKLDGSKWFGKLSTVIFYAGSVVLFFFYNLDIRIVNFIIITMGIFLIISLVLYGKSYYEMDLGNRNEE